MDAWKLFAGVLVAFGAVQLLVAVVSGSVTDAITTAVSGLLFVGFGLLALYRADVDSS